MKRIIAALCAALMVWPGSIFNARDRRIVERLNSDAIYDNIHISGVPVGGLTKDKARQALCERFRELENLTVTLTGAKEPVSFTLRELGGFYNADRAIDAAWNYAREGGNAERVRQLNLIAETPLSLEADFIIDGERLDSVIDSLSKRLYSPPTEPSLRFNNGVFSVSDPVCGSEVDAARLKKMLMDILTARESASAELPLTAVNPKLAPSDLWRATSLLGSSSTDMSASSENRVKNLALAASRLNGVMIMPGEVFSTNAALNPGTGDNGYLPAGSYLNGEVVDSVGGGVCQAATTLYMALLCAELPVVERQNHSMPVAYADYGFDATLAEGLIDLKFKNTTELPVTLECFIADGRLRVNIYGEETRPYNRTLRFENELVEVMAAPEQEVISDPLLPKDGFVVEVKARDGYVYKLYKLVYVNNALVNRVQINTSTYKPVRGKARVGIR
ncbi:MAG: VanW family protein [Clostridiales bacterium]|jgi:vancomycin resistance protein YoaR|nr:VanW family protein [Clostridiales bacterium]